MDRALKERLIGAIVLVVVAVLVVPVFLDGPSSDDEIVTEPVTLPGQNDQPRTQQTIVLERDRDEPVPSAVPAPDPVPVEAPTPEPVAEQAADTSPEQAEEADEAETVAADVVEQSRSDRPPEQVTAAPQNAPAGGLWAVQLGSFSNRENAEKLASDLRGEGYAAFLSRLEANGGELHRVRVGPQKDRDSAESVAASLADSGHKGQVVTHP